jgi:hypothetical protein
MKTKSIKIVSAVSICAMLLTSCYTHTSVVGTGAQGSTEVKKWNHYAIAGLVPIEVSDSKQMAGGAENYTITTKHSFVNLLVSGLTGSLYSPTTTIVTK